MNTTPMFTKIHSFITHHQLLTPHTTIIIGLSGGPDSVFLLHLLVSLQKQYDITVIAAHLDHEWRAQSFNDVLFCKQLCEQVGIQFITQKLSALGLPLKFNGSQEEIGRKARRYFLEKVCTEMKAHVIALGHHAQDQQETFFIRLLRGASLTGLTAMKARDTLYIRPLLHTNKTDIIAYLQAHSLLFVVDPSNESDLYLRNKIRSTVIPALKGCDNRFDASFMATMQRLQETESLLDDLVQHTFATIATEAKPWRVNCDQLLSLHSDLRYRILIHWFCKELIPFTPSQSFFDEIVRFLNGNKSHKHALHTQWILMKKKNLAWVEKMN